MRRFVFVLWCFAMIAGASLAWPAPQDVWAQSRQRRRVPPREVAGAPGAPVEAVVPETPPQPALTAPPEPPPAVAPARQETPAPPRPPEPPRHHANLGLFAGHGLDADNPENLGPSFGVRAGYSLGTSARLYVGATLTYHLGLELDGYDPLKPTVSRVRTSRLFFGGEAGVEPTWSIVRIRPYATVGRLSAEVECRGPCRSGRFTAPEPAVAFGLGLDVRIVIGPVSLGAETRVLFTSLRGSVARLPTLGFTVAVTLP